MTAPELSEGRGAVLRRAVSARPWRRSGAPACAQVAERLEEILDGGAPAESSLVQHVECCLACQAELARYRKLMRLLHQLRTPEVEVPPGVVADVLSALGGAANRRAVRSLLSGRRLGYTGAAVAAVTAASCVGLMALLRVKGAARSIERPEPRQL